jgi:holo-[acyl-carrier protein] synthase
MIIGIGTDIVQVDRIDKVLHRFGDKFVGRILTAEERECFDNHQHKAAFLAKRFSAKEAVSKALKTGIGVISWQEIIIYKRSSGAPGVRLEGSASTIFAKQGGRDILLSLSDERAYALAFVVISGVEPVDN